MSTHVADTVGTAGATAVRRPPRIGAVVVAVSLVQLCLVLVFAWSASRSAPHDLPLLVAGPAGPANATVEGLESAQPGAFALSVVSDAETARAEILDRKAYGAIVLEPTGVTVYTASAASPTVAQALATEIPQALRAQQPDVSVTVTDVAPNPVGDPHGAGIPTALIPLTITSLVAGAAVALLARDRRTRLIALSGYAVLAGLLTEIALHPVLGVLTGSWSAEAGFLSLVALAISGAMAGATALGRGAGAAAAVTVLFFLGFPLSGAMSAWELVPTPWGQLAQLLPVGAADVGLRSVSFFGGSGAGLPTTVLVTWVVLGLLALGLRRPLTQS